MNGQDLRAARKSAAMTQHELAEKLGVSRKTVVGWEQDDADLDEGVALRVRQLVGQIHVIQNTYSVEPTLTGAYAVVGRRLRTLPSEWAAGYFHGETMLFGVFARRDHAYRWSSALLSTANPRNTRKLRAERARDAV